MKTGTWILYGITGGWLLFITLGMAIVGRWAGPSAVIVIDAVALIALPVGLQQVANYGLTETPGWAINTLTFGILVWLLNAGLLGLFTFGLLSTG